MLPRSCILRPQSHSYISCLAVTAPWRASYSTPAHQAEAARPTIAPRASIDIKDIRQNAALYAQNCLDRNYIAQSTYPAQITALFDRWQSKQQNGRNLRVRSNLLRRQLSNPSSLTEQDGADALQIKALGRDGVIEELRRLKEELAGIDGEDGNVMAEIERLALAIPNLTSEETPRGHTPRHIEYLNKHPEPDPTASNRIWQSHVHIGSELNLLDFSASATSTGWGWYYLLNEAAQLEQALVQYALSVAMSYGWQIVSPPSIVYSHIAAACGFQPRDQHDEQQIYTLSQSASDVGRGRPELSLAATAEIPLAAILADKTVDSTTLPRKNIAVSRCYRAEAGARGVDTKGLYRVHEFTKVEMFGWTLPSYSAATPLFDEMVTLQKQILSSLGLHCRVLEMPTADLGASATRKNDIEAFFPSRRAKDEGWGEVTSASICTDYQTRRLSTRMRNVGAGGKLEFPWTVNGTAMAVPRVLAAVLENGWDERGGFVVIPEVLRPWMGGLEKIERR